jgi:hypothetical protein
MYVIYDEQPVVSKIRLLICKHIVVYLKQNNKRVDRYI